MVARGSYDHPASVQTAALSLACRTLSQPYCQVTVQSRLIAQQQEQQQFIGRHPQLSK